MGTQPFEAGESQDAEAEQDSQAEASQQERQRKIKAAMAFLRAALAGGPRPAAEVEAEARACGIAHSTLAEARKRLYIASKRRGQAWVWIPPRAWRKKQPLTV